MEPPDEARLRKILSRTQVIALVGASMNPARASHQVGHYLVGAGFRVIPVNPGHAGERLFGEAVRARLSDCPLQTDMVDVFRRPEHVPDLVNEALAHLPQLNAIWLQLGITHPQAAQVARARGVDMVEDRCIKIDHARLMTPL